MATDIQLHKQQAQDLSNKLWAIANDLRGTMDSSKFKDYILGIIFYRFLSEKSEKYMAELLRNENMTYEDALVSDNEELLAALDEYSLDGLGFIIRPEYSFKYVVNMIANKYEGKTFSVDYLEKAIASIQQSTLGQKSEAAFDGIFDAMDLKDKDLGKEVSDRTRQIAKVINKVADIPFSYDDAQFDVLGTAYMILIGLFASDSGKKGGEFFTPSAVSELCARLATVGLTSVKSVCDPTCGSASMLLEVRKAVIENGGTLDSAVGHYYGQELNGTTYNLARMNMLMHDVDYLYFNLYNDNTLETDNFKDIKEGFTVQVANPPYSAKWSASSKFLDDPRFSGAGKLAPSSKADFAFVEHMVYHMADDGRIAVLLPHGVLFRGGSEDTIRRYLINDLNVLDAVIGLPANLFHGTGIPVCCLVLKKNRNGNSGNICFIDASKYFTPGKNMNQLSGEDIERILSAYAERKEIEKFCHVATIEEIKENDYNLNIPRYVDTFEEEEEIDIKAVMAEIKELETQRASLDEEINKYLKELGILED